ncbi:MAG: diphosphomevalonate decarboxylase [Candidatus Kapaibacteriota bacterium]
MKKIKVKSHPNIALVKYWGKRSEEKNLPSVGSISITLDELSTITEVYINKISNDEFIINNKKANEREQQKISKFLDYFRARSSKKYYLKIKTTNNFPTAAGLASSASGYAALTYAANHIFDLNLSAKELTQYARLGSGSAARSIFGGYVELHKGELESGEDCFAEQILAPDQFPLKVIVAITDETPKKTSSRDGMKLSQQTSPFFQSFVETSEQDISFMKQAIKSRDFYMMSEIAQQSCIKMHSVMMTTKEPLFYWNSKTFSIIEFVLKFQKEKYPIFFTIDAGPQVKIVTLPGEEKNIIEKLTKLNVIQQHFVIGLGNGTEIIEE